METLYNILKFSGIVAGIYYSYIGFSQKFRNDDGSLTEIGKKARNGIILSGLISISGFLLESYIPKPKAIDITKEDNFKYPIENIEASADSEVSINDTLSYFRNITKKFNELKMKSNPKYKNHIYFIKDSLGNDTGAILFYDKKGIPNNVSIPNEYILNADFFIKKKYASLDFNESPIYFTLNNDTSKIKSFGGLYGAVMEEDSFDLVLNREYIKTERVTFYPPSTLVLHNRYKMEITSNGKITNLKQLEKALAVSRSSSEPLITQYHTLHTGKGYKLRKCEICDMNFYNSDKKKVGFKHSIGRYILSN